MLGRYVKKMGNHGPAADPEYRSALPKVTEYRAFCPVPPQAIMPTSLPETVYDIKHFARDQRRNRPPIKHTILKRTDVEKMMKKTIELSDFPRPCLTVKFVEDDSAIGGGY